MCERGETDDRDTQASIGTQCGSELTEESRLFPWISTGWTRGDLAKPTFFWTALTAPPLRPNAEAAVAKTVTRARDEIFMVFSGVGL